MINLTITTDLIHELHERGTRTGRPDQTAIVLDCDGWDTTVWAEKGPDSGLIALTAEDILGWLGGEDMDDDCAQALTVPDGGGDYRIPCEDGSIRPPGTDVDVQVVTGIANPGDRDGGEKSWESAYWFDLGRAAELVTEAKTGTGLTSALWRTAGGRYLLRICSQWVGQPAVQWVEVTVAQAVEYVYAASPDRLADDLPAELEAARLAAGIVGTLAAPEYVADSDPDVSRARARRHEPEAAHLVAAIQAISELLRARVLSDLRGERAAAARVVLYAHDDDRAAAADRLGIAYPTLSNLIK